MTRVSALCGVVLGVAAAAQQPPPDQQQAQKAWNENERGLNASFRGDQTEAERLYRDAMTIWKQLGPAYEGHLATTEANLADVLALEGRRRDAAKLLDDAVTLFRHSVGYHHPSTITALTTLAGIYLMMGQTTIAQTYFEEALPLARQYTPDGVQMARVLVGLSVIKLRTQKAEEALPLGEESLRAAIKSSGEDSMDTALAYLAVAEVHRVTNHPERAMPLFRKARSIYEHILGPEHLRVAVVLSQEGLILLDDGKVSLAEKEMTRALDIVRNHFPNAKPELFVVETNLALVRMKQGKYSDAERLLTTAIAREEREPVSSVADVAGALNTLASIREKQRMYDEAARLHKRADAMLSFSN